MKTIQVNIPIRKGISMVNNPEPLEARLRELATANQEQASMIAAQEQLLTTYEAELDRQASRLSKCLWAIAGLSLALILVIVLATG